MVIPSDPVGSVPASLAFGVGGLEADHSSFVEATGKAAFYFSEPMSFPPEFRRVDERSRILLAMPVSSREHDLVKSNGAALEELLEASGADPFCVRRASVCWYTTATRVATSISAGSALSA